MITPFLLIRAYFWDIGSYQMMSPADEPITISKCDEVLVKSLMSWHSICALVKSTFVRCSSFVGEVTSSHWNARLMLANAKTPLGSRSFSRFADVSWVMTLDTNEEVLLIILFFGFRRFASFELAGGGASAGFPSPNCGAVTLVVRNVGGLFRASRVTKDTLTPDVGGFGTVARGFGLTIGASDGCGGGVARRRSSFRMYVPAIFRG